MVFQIFLYFYKILSLYARGGTTSSKMFSPFFINKLKYNSVNDNKMY